MTRVLDVCQDPLGPKVEIYLQIAVSECGALLTIEPMRNLNKTRGGHT